MAHELSETVERDKQFFVESTVEPGKVLEGPFSTENEANMQAMARSEEQNLIQVEEKNLIEPPLFSPQYGEETSKFLSLLSEATQDTFDELALSLDFNKLVTNKDGEEEFGTTVFLEKVSSAQMAAKTKEESTDLPLPWEDKDKDKGPDKR